MINNKDWLMVVNKIDLIKLSMTTMDEMWKEFIVLSFNGRISGFHLGQFNEK